MTTTPEPERSTPFEVHMSDQAKALIDSINKVAAEIGAPPAFYESAWDADGNPTVWRMDPGFQRVLRDNPALFDDL